MRKTIALLLFVTCLFVAQTAFAHLDERRSDITAKYGEYRMVLDENGRLWTKAEWEKSGGKEVASTYIYQYKVKDLKIQLDVKYEDGIGKKDPYVRSQRFSPDWFIQIKDLKTYLPEIYDLVASPEASVFTTREKLTRNFMDDVSPITLGVMVAKEPASAKGKYTLIGFNVRGEGTLIKEPKLINGDTYVTEICLEWIYKIRKNDPDNRNDWKWQNSVF